MMLARYDRAIARSLVEPLVRGTGTAPVYFSSRGELHVAAAAIDPKWAVTLVEATSRRSRLEDQSPKNSARLAVANVLGRAGEQRFRKLRIPIFTFGYRTLKTSIPTIEAGPEPVHLRSHRNDHRRFRGRPEHGRCRGSLEPSPRPGVTSCRRRATRSRVLRCASIGLASEKPEDLLVKVTFRGSRQRYAQLRYGSPSSVRVTIVLDEIGRGAADLYVDANRNRRIEAADRVNGENRTWRLPLDLAIVEGETTRYERRACLFRLGATGITFSYAAAGYLGGQSRIRRPLARRPAHGRRRQRALDRPPGSPLDRPE